MYLLPLAARGKTKETADFKTCFSFWKPLLVTASEDSMDPFYCKNDKNISNWLFFPLFTSKIISQRHPFFSENQRNYHNMGELRVSWHFLPDILE